MLGDKSLEIIPQIYPMSIKIKNKTLLPLTDLVFKLLIILFGQERPKQISIIVSNTATIPHSLRKIIHKVYHLKPPLAIILQAGVDFLVIQFTFNYYFLGFLMFACAAASLAIGTLNGEHET